MKTPYFTTENIHQKGREHQAAILSAVGSRGRQPVPVKTALLVIDMQRYFVEPGGHAFLPASRAILGNLRELVRLFYGHHRPVVFTRHGNTEENTGMMGTWWADSLEPGSHQSELVPELDTSHGKVLDKHQYDAFHETGLEDHLRELGVSQLVICGVMTHLCCETTARSAFVRGFEVFFTIDGTASASEDFHLATLLNLAHGFASPVLAEEIISWFEEEA